MFRAHFVLLSWLSSRWGHACHSWRGRAVVAAIVAGPALCAAADTGTSGPSAAPQPGANTAAASTTASATTTAAVPAKSIISLLLPLNAPDFNAPAGAVQKGCEAALTPDAATLSLDIARTNADPANITAAWTAAAERGAGVIVGPLTRNAVTALAAALSDSPLNRSAFPASASANAIARPPLTLTLNAPEDATTLPLRFYTFGLVVEQEARAVARMAWADGRRSAFVVQANNPLARRSGQAFASEWLALGGRIAEADDFDGGAADMSELKTRLGRAEAERGDMIFLSANAAEARRARPYLNNQIPVYATSQVNDGRQDAGINVDLAGIHFVDMPWMMQPDHPAVMVYPRPDYASPELQRFYALGVDACRIASQLLAQRSRIDVDGVTGRLSLTLTPGASGTAVSREPMLAIFADPSAATPPPEAAPPAIAP